MFKMTVLNNVFIFKLRLNNFFFWVNRIHYNYTVTAIVRIIVKYMLWIKLKQKSKNPNGQIKPFF